ncbi:unnamed protein product [Malus baccata var. baccata]
MSILILHKFSMATSGHKEPSISRGGWSAAIFIIFVEVAERFVYFGMSGNLITCLTNELHEGYKECQHLGWSLLSPHSNWSLHSRCLSWLIQNHPRLFDHLLLLSVIPLHYQKAMFFVALYILSIGLAGHRPCAQTFAVDQFCEDSPEEKKAKNNVGWAAGFGILTGAMVVALALFLFGYKKFRRQGPLGSPFTTVAQVFVAATRKPHLDGTLAGFGVYRDDKSHETNGTLAHTSQFSPKNHGHSSGITILQRIGIGLFLSIITMVVSGLVEAKRVSVVKYHNLLDNPKAVVPVRVWWLIPQYMVCGLSDLFALVGIQEFFYDQMPEEMRSLGAAAYLNVNGVGSFITRGINLVQAISSKHGEKWLSDNINRAHLNYFYWVIVALSTLNLCVHLWIAKRFVYKKFAAEVTNEEKERT